MSKDVRMKMTVNQWIKVEDNPIQRNTERHAAKAVRRHLQSAARSHKYVAAAQLPNGDMYKLDGHTRAHLWATGQLETPKEALDVTVYKVADHAEVIELYRLYDNAAASEGTVDKMWGAFRQHGFIPESALIKNGGLTTALRTLYYKTPTFKSFSINEQVGEWLYVLHKVDSRGYSHKRFNCALMAMLLATVAIDGEQAFEFWDLHDSDRGYKYDGKRDGVQSLTEAIAYHKQYRMTSGWLNNREMMGKALTCYKAFYKGRHYTSRVRGTDIDAYLCNNLGIGKVPYMSNTTATPKNTPKKYAEVSS